MTNSKILVADDLGAEGLGILEQAGEVTVKTGMDEATLKATLPGYHAVIVRSATTVTAKSLEDAKDLVVIGRAGIGIDNIDVSAATERGIVVMNTPLTAAVTTAEHAIALMMALARNIGLADASMRAGKWDKKALVGTELRGKTLGVVGLGKIGSVAAQRGLGLGMRVVASDPAVDPSNAPKGIEILGFDDLLATADFVTLHLPILPLTRHLFGAETFTKMKAGARLIHAARGGIVDEAALIQALDSGHLAGAALDVFEQEPLPADHPLRTHPKVLLTPHLGASTAEAKRNVSIDMANQIVACLRDGIVLNGVNAPRLSPSDAPKVAPYLALTQDLARLLASVFPGEIASLGLTLQGPVPTCAPDAMAAEMIAGALGARIDTPVTPVNAQHVAGERQVKVTTDVGTVNGDFVNLVEVEARIDGRTHRIRGTVLGKRDARMTALDAWRLDANPAGPLLVTFHDDEPGVIGAVGGVLGEASINIDRLQLGAAEGARALGIWNLSAPLGAEVLATIAGLGPIQTAHAIA